ncbi:ribonuclease H [Senna tora]|uniref:Ribonuclease H n=1 Tax=Senna tora TaxID=362788 RepID=A0A834XKQ5_9FABA|nr:ribonuclease H [Senna tora]
MKAENTIRNLGYDNKEVAEARGYSGGIWALWKKEIKATSLYNHEQFIQIEIEDQQEVIGVYASPQAQIRDGIRPIIENICLNYNHLLIIAGDFNEIAAREEQRGGSLPCTDRCIKFQNWINDCNLIDMVPGGLFFTWEGPKRDGQEKLYKRLDRVLCSPDWRTRFVDASTKSLIRLSSDHHPILLITEEQENNPQNRPFRFEACWLQYKDFNKFIKKQWNKDSEHNSMLHGLALKLKDWNRNVFGNIRVRKNNLKRRIKGIQAALDKKFNPYLEELGRSLEKELEEVLNQEEAHWFQKARCKWIREGDRNTKYYHTKAIARRRRNKILMLKDENDEWTEDLMEIKNIITTFYKALFRKEEETNNLDIPTFKWPAIENKLRNIIMTCITTTSLNVLWNGEETEDFKPTRGLRQGDPLSPYIFVICMDLLSHIINNSASNNKWKGIKMGKNNITITHLMFADDLLLFGEATSEQATYIKDCLDRFCLITGQRINASKSSIYFSKNTKDEVANDILTLKGFKRSQEIGRYLGANITSGRQRKSNFKHIIEGVQKKLAGWKASCLSLAGRATLVQSVVATMPLYHMQHNKIPKGVINQIEKMERNFLWGSTPEKRSIHQVSWDQVCIPKTLGGLGINSLNHMNKAFIYKLAWNLLNNKKELWVEIIKNKYNFDSQSRNNLTCKMTDSRLWKEIVKLWPEFYKMVSWNIGNGSNINFWEDKWIVNCQSLKSQLGDNNGSNNGREMLNNYVDEIGQWKLQELEEKVPVEIIRKIVSIKPPDQLMGRDIPSWDPGKNGAFTIRSAYLAIKELKKETRPIWDSIWKASTTQRNKLLLWRLGTISSQ